MSKTLRPVTYLAVFALCVFLLPPDATGLASRLEAADPDKAEVADKAADKISDEVKTIVGKLTKFYRELKSVETDCEIALDMQIGKQSQKRSAKKRLALSMPNLISLRTEGEMPGLDLISDGKTLVTYYAPRKAYTEADAPPSLDKILENPLLRMGGPNNFELQLFSADAVEKMMAGVISAKVVGIETVDKQKTHHLNFEQEQFDWDLWVASEGDPLLLKVTFDLSKSVNADQDVSYVFSQSFSNWKINKPIQPKRFAFVAPKGARKTDDLFAPPPSPLLGKPAPNIELTLLDGGEFNLDEHKGKHVVILDFWATWCGPCRAALPHMVELAKEYKDKGVVLYAINQREKPDEVRDFLDEEKLKLTVPLDKKGALGDAYGVRGIPTTVIIDKRGTVQVYRSGFGPGSEERMKKELDTLLAGKILVKKEAATEEKDEDEDAKSDGAKSR